MLKDFFEQNLPMNQIHDGCLCGMCAGCSCDCHFVDDVPNDILKRVLNIEGVLWEKVARMTRHEIFIEIKKQSQPIRLLHNAQCMMMEQNKYNSANNTCDKEEQKFFAK